MKKTFNPFVTVLIPLFNCEKYINKSINSILKQTYENYELLIINDGSTDNSEKIVKSIKDKRIKLINNTINHGIEYTLNRGIKLSKGKYIIRMDADDICSKNRIKKLVEFMENHKNIGICGSWLKYKFKNKLLKRKKKYLINYNNIKCSILFSSPIAHATVIMRKKLIIKYNLFYANNFNKCEDYELWSRAIEYFEISNIPKYLYIYNQNPTGVTFNKKYKDKLPVLKIQKKLLNKIYSFKERQIKFHFELSNFLLKKNLINLQKTQLWFDKLCKINQNKLIYPEKNFIYILSKQWYIACKYFSKLGLKTLLIYFKNPIYKYYKTSIYEKLILIIKCLLAY